MLVTIIHVNQTYSNAPSILVGMGHHQRVSDLSLKDLARRLPFHTSVKFGLHMLHPWHAISIGIMVIVISRHHSNAKQNLQHSQLNHALGKYQLELTSRKLCAKQASSWPNHWLISKAPWWPSLLRRTIALALEESSTKAAYKIYKMQRRRIIANLLNCCRMVWTVNWIVSCIFFAVVFSTFQDLQRPHEASLLERLDLI